MNYIEYINLPKVPENLIEPLDVIINKPPISDSDPPPDHPYYKARHVNDDLLIWLKSILDLEMRPRYQLLYDGLPIHTDKGKRVLAYNYLLDLGGENVKTTVYDNQYNPLQIEQLELKRWHRIDTGMLHGVSGIDPNRVRIAISIGFSVYR